jgi:hypothetical protein
MLCASSTTGADCGSLRLSPDSNRHAGGRPA